MYRFYIYILIFLSLTICINNSIFCDSKNRIYVALVGPLNDSTGISMKNGVNLYFNQVNKNGGIYGQQIEALTFNDQDSAVISEKAAEEIVRNNQIMAVIGHWSSSCSIAGGEIYNGKIAAVTPGSTNIDVTRKNDWYFRVIFNDEQQGGILAYYTFEILKKESVLIIGDKLDYGKGLTGSFCAAFKNFNGKIIDILEVDSSKLNNSIESSLNDLPSYIRIIKENKDSAIFLALPSNIGFVILAKLKEENVENIIITPDSFATNNSLSSINGEIMDGIYVSAPTIFDAADEGILNFKEKYNNYCKVKDVEAEKNDPDWLAIYSYDSAKIIVEAVKNAYKKRYIEYLQKNQNKSKGYESRRIKTLIKRGKLNITRKNIKEELDLFNNPENAVSGITGLNYFDVYGETSKPISIGRYKNNRITSTMIQLALSGDKNIKSDYKESDEIKYMLKGGIKYYFKEKHVIVTGLIINKIYDFNNADSTCMVDFNLWFKFNPDMQSDSIDNVIFTNSIKPFYLANYIKNGGKDPADNLNKINVELVESFIEKDIDDFKLLNYKLYHIVAPFKIDIFHSNDEYVYNQQIINVQFRHRDMDTDDLIYVIDLEGMGIADNIKSDDKLKAGNVFGKNEGLEITEIKAFSESINCDTMGHPEYVGKKNIFTKFSFFNLLVKLRKNHISLRGILNAVSAEYFTIIGLLILFILTVLFIINKSFDKRKIIIALIIINTFILLISSEIVVLNYTYKNNNYFYLSATGKIFDFLWWLIIAFFLNLFLNFYVFKNMELKSGRKLPGLLKNFAASLIYISTLFAIIAMVFNKKITSLLATSGLVAMIIGLAIQTNLSNIFSGIALNIENSIRVGDWIRIDEMYEGKVLDITWRTTRIQTDEGIVINIPNHTVSLSKIYNMSNIQKKYDIELIVHVDPKYSPSRIIKVLNDAVYSVYQIVIPPKPIVQFIGISDKTADYSVNFFINDYLQREKYKELVWKRIWIHLVRAEISPSIGSDIALIEAEERKITPKDILRQIDLFKMLSDSEINYLSEKMKRVFFKSGALIIKEGDAGNSLFIIIEGALSIRINTEDNKKLEIDRLSVGSFFGEMSLLTGKDCCADVFALTDAYLYKIEKEDFEQIIRSNTKIVSELSSLLVKYEINMELKRKTYKCGYDEEKIHKNIFSTIHEFFNIKPKVK